MNAGRRIVGIVSLLWIQSLTFAQVILPVAPDPSSNASSAIGKGSFDVYCDFRCPFCARLFASLFAGAKAEGRVVDFRFRHFPFHPGSDKLAAFYESAAINYPDKRDALIDSLYKFRSEITLQNIDAMIAALAVVHGMDLQRIKRDMKARDIEGVLSESKRSAVAMNVDSTPSVFQGTRPVVPLEPEDIARYMLDQSPHGSLAPEPSAAGECASCERQRNSK